MQNEANIDIQKQVLYQLLIGVSADRIVLHNVENKFLFILK